MSTAVMTNRLELSSVADTAVKAAARFWFAALVRPNRLATNRKKTLPNQTPVRLALALALELSPAPTHSSAALRAYPIQNAGDHI